MLDYLKWRGDLSFSQDPFNEIDNLILSILCYNDFAGIVPSVGQAESITLCGAAKIFKETKDTSGIIELPFLKEIPNLLEQTSKTKRYKNIELSNYINIVDIENTKQFSALVFKVEDLHIIAFRGTDDSLIGWKEDLQMSFLDIVQSQREAVVYSERVMEVIDSKFILVGHSKGGNLALYAASFIDEKYSPSICKIYNNDGPGFQPRIINSEEYKSILPKVKTFLPESSVIGMFLEQGGEYEIVKSSGLAIMQHNPFSWELEGKEYIRKEELTKESLNINKTIRAWITQLTKEEKSDFVDALSEILQKSGATTIADLNNEKLIMAEAMIKAYGKMNKDTKEHLKDTIDLLFKEGKKVFKESISSDIEAFRSKYKNKKEI
jgi:hypothetical protein